MLKQIKSKHLRTMVNDLDRFIDEEYKPAHPEEERDTAAYERELQIRLRRAATELRPLVAQACDIRTRVRPGPRAIMSLQQRVMILLLQRLCPSSNRMMSCMLLFFSALTNIDVSYKTIERFYGDKDVILALHNLHILILKKQGVRAVDVAGDATGYGLTITKHYATEANKLKEKAKADLRKFVYMFRLIDINTGMYVAYGTSYKSEREAYDDARRMLLTMDIDVNSIRLDRYYSAAFYADQWPDSLVYIIPKKNVTSKGSWHWKRTLFRMYNDLMTYLEEFFMRNSSENGFGIDKRRFGWTIPQRRDDRISVANAAISILHNLFRLTTY